MELVVHALGIYGRKGTNLILVRELNHNEALRLCKAGEERVDKAPLVTLLKEHSLAKTWDEAVFAALREEFASRKDVLRSINMDLTKEALRLSADDDVLVCQTVSALDEIARTAAGMTKKYREWYAYHLPELERSIADHEVFVRESLHGKDELMRGMRIKESVGGSFSEPDIKSMLAFGKRILDLYAERDRLKEYLETLLKRHAPNIQAVAGTQVGAKLIAAAGSVRRIAVSQSSYAQLLGAEMALFRHKKKNDARPPKHGLIIQHPFVAQAPRDQRGRAARILADKIAIAARIDYFRGEFAGASLAKGLTLENVKRR
ncbi:MAG: NOP5/NOP56 family protein [Nanoarchaeota archaeon]